MAWRLRIPSILLLLVAGYVAGPVTGWLNPDVLFGDTMFAAVSLAVAIILFEGGLSLDIAELKKIGGGLPRLVIIGSPITWAVASLLAYWLLGFEPAVAALLGAILVVTGPTVIIPLLRQVRPSRRVSSIARWEGIVSDPVGAILAVLVFDFIIVSGLDAGWQPAMRGAATAVLAGGGLGLLGAGVVVLMLKRYWVPDYLRSHVTLAVVLTVFVASNHVLAESGLLAVTVMGSAIASQKIVSITRIVHFKENLRVLLISALFVVLAARLPLSDPAYADAGVLIFVAAVILVQRPLAVMIATIGSDLDMRERIFLSALAPRGIVAAAVGSVFSIELMHANIAGGERLAAVIFLVIIVTVTFYGLIAGPLARRLGLAVKNPQGVLFIGASAWVRDIAGALFKRGIRVLVVDANWHNVAQSRSAGIPAVHANILAEDILDELELDGIGQCVLATPNDEVNALAADHLREVFDIATIHQVAPTVRESKRDLSLVPSHLQARLLSAADMTWKAFDSAHRSGYTVRQTNLTGEFGFSQFVDHYDGQAIPLFATREDGMVEVMVAGRKKAPRAGSVIVSLAPPDEVAAPS